MQMNREFLGAVVAAATVYRKEIQKQYVMCVCHFQLWPRATPPPVQQMTAHSSAFKTTQIYYARDERKTHAVYIWTGNGENSRWFARRQAVRILIKSVIAL